MKISAPRGTKDILPEEAARWQWLEDAFRRKAALYGFGEIRTPLFEETELFARSVGEESEVVTKQMYTFTDRGGRSLTLRPEGTAGVVRAYLESGLAGKGGVQRLFYFGPFFRYERPQKGRFRQFWQAGVEIFGSDSPQADAETIALAQDFLDALGIKSSKLKVNSTGCRKCRGRYQEALREALAPVVENLCGWCQERYKGNTMRILDEKRPECRKYFGNLPSILDYVCAECKEHFVALQEELKRREFQYEIDGGIVRGLDYYTRTVFEITQPGIGAQDALIGGGRYDNLVEDFGGKPTPAVGWAGGIERILAALEESPEDNWPPEQGPIYIVTMGEESEKAASSLLTQLRNAGLSAINDLEGRSLKAQMKEASRISSPYVGIVGEDEMTAGAVTVRDMKTGEQQVVRQEDLARTLKDLVEKKQS